MTQALSLRDQKAIVTGGAEGIGAAVALALAKAGAAVGINYRHDADDAEALAEEIRRDGGEAITLKADVSKEEQVHAMFERFVESCGRVDIVVANAGVQDDAPITQMTLEQWHKVLDINLTGAFLCAREAIRRFIAQGLAPASSAIGKIICMSSVHELIPWAGHANYAASKGGLMLLMRTLAQEVAAQKIRINSIAPGAIKTAINHDEWANPESLKKLLKLVPYGRIGESEDVGKAAVWLASDESDYVVGTTLFVDGGMSLYPGFRENG